MRYPLITGIIVVVWAAMLTVSAAYPENATNIFYLTLFCTMAIFHLGFQMRSK